MKKLIKFKDSVHGFTAYANSQTMAWALIRSKCHKLNVDVPTYDQITLA